MSLIFTIQEDALDCAMALGNAGRVYRMTRTVDGKFEIIIAQE